MNKSSTQRTLPMIFQKNHRKSHSKIPFSIRVSPSKPAEDSFIIQNSYLNNEKSPEIKQILTHTGPEAKLKFYDNYKNIGRLTERLEAHKIEMNSNIAYLSSLNKRSLKPKSFGMVREAGAESSIDIRMFSMGDEYAEPFAQGLKYYPLLENLNLKSNRLTDLGNSKILESVDLKHLKRLNLSENKVGVKSLKNITDLISTYDCHIKYLNLEKTGLTDSLVPELCNVLGYNRRLTKLILAKNKLTDGVSGCLKKMLLENESLLLLDLHWNNFGPYGAENIFEGIGCNNTLIELDISWNSIGRLSKCSETIGKSIKKNNSLAHLDLSYNFLTQKDCDIIGEYLKSNHTLLGIHALGNSCTIDAKGFLIPKTVKKTLQKSHFFYRISKRPKEPYKKSINCWVCEKWVECTFICTSPGQNVFIHIDVDDFQPDHMTMTQSFVFTITRAVPARKISFFFTELNGLEVSSKYEILLQKTQKVVSYNNHVKKTLNIDTLYTLNPSGEICNIKSPFSTKPRLKGSKDTKPSSELIRIIWRISTSIFKDHTTDNKKILDDCLDFDWKHSHIPNFVKSPEDLSGLKSCVGQYYSLLKTTYKKLSTYSGVEVFSIGSNALTDFLYECKIIDSLYAITDLGVNLKSALLQKVKGQLYNPGNSLVRYEFIEILVRISSDKYIRNKVTDNVTSAFNMLLDHHLLPVIMKSYLDDWRAEKYLCEEVDLVLRANKSLFEVLYRVYSGKYTLPGKKKFMSLDEFRTVCSHAGLVSDSFATREIDVCFCQAMETQVDELYKKRHVEMSFSEWLEGVCRAVDCSKTVIADNLVSIIRTDLSSKIETLVPVLLKLCPLSFQDEFQHPVSETYTKMMYKIKIASI